MIIMLVILGIHFDAAPYSMNFLYFEMLDLKKSGIFYKKLLKCLLFAAFPPAQYKFCAFLFGIGLLYLYLEDVREEETKKQ